MIGTQDGTKVKRLTAWLGLALLGAGSSIALAFNVTAAPPPDVFRDADDNVYVIGATAEAMGDRMEVTSQDEPLTRRRRAGFCGETRLSTTSTLPALGDSWTLRGQTYTRTGFVTVTDRDALPKCRNATWTPALTPEITAAGGFVDATVEGRDRVYILGGEPGVSDDVTFNDVPSSSRKRPNACGFFRISNTLRNPIPATLTIGENTYTVNQLPVGVPPLCRRVGNNYEMFTPTDWDN